MANGFRIILLALPLFVVTIGRGIEPLVLTDSDRVLVLAPHPDDEVIGCGGVLVQASERKLPVRIVYLTYGDNNQWSFLLYRKRPVLMPRSVRNMGLVRHDEAIAAAAVCGVASNQLTFLGYPDFGTFGIWQSHWDERTALRSMFTRTRSVPYSNALRPGAPYKGEEILADLKTVLREFRPTKVFLPHPADHNADHRALYLFTRVALWDLERELQAELFPYLIHFKHWPLPRGYRPEASLDAPPDLRTGPRWLTFALASNEVTRKRIALQAHRSQYKSSPRSLDAFIRRNELFGDFPVVVLTNRVTHGSLAASPSDNRFHPPSELTDRERAVFVGLEQRYARLENGDFVLSICFSRPLAEGVEASVYVFGYRADRPFSEMPKIQIKLDELTHAVFDQRRRLARSSISVERDLHEITLRVPVALLGGPQRLLTSARTYLSEVPLDWVTWRALELTSPVIEHTGP